MEVRQMTGYKISQNPAGGIQIAARHDYIAQIIYLSVRIKFTILNIANK
jgi:hypothetical protein